MKTKSLLTLFAVICAASISAQTSNYAGSEAAKHVGETATVTDKVDGVQAGNNRYPYRNWVHTSHRPRS